jgi:hypothetical protein
MEDVVAPVLKDYSDAHDRAINKTKAPAASGGPTLEDYMKEKARRQGAK